ncbi:MAG: hypothetical protein GF364_15655 [Candidatus Lokiarchaeota archaeon]|nr:hypothetical protein [Candidatus Lokiarchaeota archaeon]
MSFCEAVKKHFIVSRFMLFQQFGELSDEVGYILSPIVKMIVIVALGTIVIAMIGKYKQKRKVITRNLMIMFVLYLLATLFSSFDILLGWEYLFSPGTEKTYIGMGLAFFFNGLGNIIYYWFTLEIYYEKSIEKEQRNKQVLIIAILEIGSTGTAMILRILISDISFLFTVIHMIVTMYIFMLVLINSVRSEVKIDEEEYKVRFRSIATAAGFAIVMIVLFAIDSLFAGVTIYSLIGWLCLIGACYYLHRGYV